MKEKKGGCCKDQEKHFKLKADHQKTSIEPAFAFTAVAIVPDFFNLPQHSFHNNLAVQYPSCNAPPFLNTQRLHVLHCVFLI